MKQIRKMITVYKPIWEAYRKALKVKGEAEGHAITISQDLSKYMKGEAEEWK